MSQKRSSHPPVHSLFPLLALPSLALDGSFGEFQSRLHAHAGKILLLRNRSNLVRDWLFYPFDSHVRVNSFRFQHVVSKSNSGVRFARPPRSADGAQAFEAPSEFFLPIHFNSLAADYTIFHGHPLYREASAERERALAKKAAENFSSHHLMSLSSTGEATQGLRIQYSDAMYAAISISAFMKLVAFLFPHRLTAGETGLAILMEGANLNMTERNNSPFWPAFQNLLKVDENSLEFSRFSVVGELGVSGKFSPWLSYRPAEEGKTASEELFKRLGNSILLIDSSALLHCYQVKRKKKNRKKHWKARKLSARPSGEEAIVQQLTEALKPIIIKMQRAKDEIDVEYEFSPRLCQAMFKRCLISPALAVANQLIKALLGMKLETNARLGRENNLAVKVVMGEEALQEGITHVPLLDCLLASYESTGDSRYRSLQQWLAKPLRAAQAAAQSAHFGESMILEKVEEIPAELPPFLWRIVHVHLWVSSDLILLERKLRDYHFWATNERFQHAQMKNEKFLDGGKMNNLFGSACGCSCCSYGARESRSKKQLFRTYGKWATLGAVGDALFLQAGGESVEDYDENFYEDFDEDDENIDDDEDSGFEVDSDFDVSSMASEFSGFGGLDEQEKITIDIEALRAEVVGDGGELSEFSEILPPASSSPSLSSASSFSSSSSFSADFDFPLLDSPSVEPLIAVARRREAIQPIVKSWAQIVRETPGKAGKTKNSQAIKIEKKEEKLPASGTGNLSRASSTSSDWEVINTENKLDESSVVLAENPKGNSSSAPAPLAEPAEGNSQCSLQ